MTTDVRTLARSDPAAPSRLPVVLMAVLVLVVGVFQAATIRPGHLWLDDFASYVSHARNIVEGVPYDDTGYIYNPANAVAGPRAYPPAYPVMLAPVYAIAGLDLDAMKVQLVVLFMLLLVAVFAYVRRRHGPWIALGVAGSIALNPFMWSFKDNVLSDIPFALLVLVALYAIERARDANASGASSLAGGAGVGALIAAAYATRTVGIVLAPALVAYVLIRDRRVPRFVVVACGTFFALAAIEFLIVPGGSGYVDQLRLASPRLTLVNAWRYFRSLEGLTINTVSSVAGSAVFAATAALALVGYVSRLRRERITCAEVFVPLYVGLIAIWPSFQSLRFLIPVIPFYVLYAIVGVDLLARIGRRPTAVGPALIVAAVIIAASYASVYARVDYGPLPEGVGTPETRAMFAYVRANTGSESIVIFQRPKALALYTGRRSSPYSADWSDEQMWTYFRTIGAAYAVDGSVDHGFFARFAARNPGSVTVVYENVEHRVYRMRL